MAGFEVITYGRFWVIAEARASIWGGSRPRKPIPILKSKPLADKDLLEGRRSYSKRQQIGHSVARYLTNEGRDPSTIFGGRTRNRALSPKLFGPDLNRCCRAQC